MTVEFSCNSEESGKDESNLNQAFLLIMFRTPNDFPAIMKSLLSDVAVVQYKLKTSLIGKQRFYKLRRAGLFYLSLPKFKYNEENCRIDHVMTIYFSSPSN